MFTTAYSCIFTRAYLSLHFFTYVSPWLLVLTYVK